MAIIDRNRDLLLVPVHRIGVMGRAMKLGGMVQSLKWNDSSNMLSAFQDAHLTVWYYPGVVFVDRELLPLTVWEKDSA